MFGEWERVSLSELENPGGRAGRWCGLAIFLRMYLDEPKLLILMKSNLCIFYFIG